MTNEIIFIQSKMEPIKQIGLKSINKRTFKTFLFNINLRFMVKRNDEML